MSPRSHSDATGSRSRSRRLRLHFVAHVRSSPTQTALPNKSASRQESNEFWREASGEAHSHGEEQGFVDAIGKNGDSIQAIRMTGCCDRSFAHIMRRGRRGGPPDCLCHLIFKRVCNTAHLICAEEIYSDEGNTEVDETDADVHAERIPAMGLNKMF